MFDFICIVLFRIFWRFPWRSVFRPLRGFHCTRVFSTFFVHLHWTRWVFPGSGVWNVLDAVEIDTIFLLQEFTLQINKYEYSGLKNNPHDLLCNYLRINFFLLKQWITCINKIRLLTNRHKTKLVRLYLDCNQINFIHFKRIVEFVYGVTGFWNK